MANKMGLCFLMERHGILIMIAMTSFILNAQASSVTFIKPCQSSDRACMIDSAQSALYHFVDGIPELEIPSSDPMFIKSAQLEYNSLVLQYSNISLHGIRNTKILNFERDVKTNTVKIEAEFPLEAFGVYELSAKFSLLNFSEKGKFHIKSDKVIFTVTSNVEEFTGPYGQKYWQIGSMSYTYDTVDKTSFKFKNLDGTDKIYGEVIETALSYNWRNIANEFGLPITKELASTLLEYINKLFLAVPSDRLVY